MISKLTAGRGGSLTVHFGTNKVLCRVDTFPCRVWRVIRPAQGPVSYELIKRIALTTREDRRVAVREAAVREAKRGWCSDAADQWVEVRPDDWRPPDTRTSDQPTSTLERP